MLSIIHRRAAAVAVLLLALLSAPAFAQQQGVTAQIELASGKKSRSGNTAALADVALWLTPLDAPAGHAAKDAPLQQLVQRNKTFEPHLLVVQIGEIVRFPNKDPFFHNVFSLYNGKRFDLGLYESGSSKSLRFDRPGVSFLFCNIHPEMNAAVIAVDTPYHAVSDNTGHVLIPNVPDGRYQLSVWSERSLPDALKQLSREVTISASGRSLGVIRVIENPNFSLSHKNKYGGDYLPPPTAGYTH